jgi:hypothetical protein
MNSSKIFLFASLLMAPAAFAAPKFTCVSAEELDQRTQECSDNHHYAKAGEDCLKKLEGLVKSGRQSKEEILAAAKSAKKHVSAYRDDIYYPEDWDAPEELIGDPMDFFDSEKCYAEARDSLKKTEEAIDRYIAEYGSGRGRPNKK